MDNSLITASIGFVGVIVGGLVTGLKEWYLHRLQAQKSAQYLAVRVVCALERYAGQCADVAHDQGEQNERGDTVAQTAAPDFSVEQLDVEWRSLPSTLLFSVLDFPSREEAVRRCVQNAFDFADPPDYEQGFLERQHQYADLGLAALSLASSLRRHAKLPDHEASGSDTHGALRAAQAKVSDYRAIQAEQILRAQSSTGRPVP